MSVEEIPPAPPLEERESSSGSLEARMAARGRELERQQGEWFGIPGYEDMLEVQLKPLGYKTIRAVQHRNERIKDAGSRELANMADQLVTATQGFREILPGGGHRDLPDGWVDLARRASTENNPFPPDGTDRQAVIFVCTDKRIVFLVEEYGRWQRAQQQRIDGEVVSDFEGTG